MIRKFLEQKPEFALNPANMDNLIPIPNPLGNIKPISNARSMNQVVNIDMGGITMNGVNDPEELANRILPEFQKSKGFERLLV